jgi:hypothetical protein
MVVRPPAGLLLGGTLLIGVLVLGSTGASGAAAGQVCVGVVVDDGGYNGSGPAAVQTANIGPGSSDLQALQAAGDTAYQNSSGLVCAIDDGSGEVPANGVENCSAASGSSYYYWSYWEGDPYTNTWTYASIGPAEHTVNSGQTYVEGWRFQNPGPDNASAPKPSVTPAAAFAQACSGVQPVPGGGSGGSGGSASGGSGGSSGGDGSSGGSPGTPDPSDPTTTTPAPTGTDSGAPRTAGGSATNSAIGVTTTTHPGAGVSSTPADGTHSSSTTTTSADSGARTKPGDSKSALADPKVHDASGGGNAALPVVMVAAVILVLGGLAWWRWRRRPLEE